MSMFLCCLVYMFRLNLSIDPPLICPSFSHSSTPVFAISRFIVLFYIAFSLSLALFILLSFSLSVFYVNSNFLYHFNISLSISFISIQYALQLHFVVVFSPLRKLLARTHTLKICKLLTPQCKRWQRLPGLSSSLSLSLSLSHFSKLLTTMKAIRTNVDAAVKMYR